MKRDLRIAVALAAVVGVMYAYGLYAQNKVDEGGTISGGGGEAGAAASPTPGDTASDPPFTLVGGWDDQTAQHPFLTDESGVMRVIEEYPPSASAPTLFTMTNGFDMSTTGTITEIGTAWPSAGDYYNKALVIGVNMQTDNAAGVDVFLEVSHTGAGNYNLVIYKNAAGVEDTVSWKFVADTPDTTAGLGLWCAIPVEAQNAVNAAQFWRASARSPASTGHATFWISAVGKR